MAQQTSMTQPPPQVKKSNPWKIATGVLLLGIVGMGVVIGVLLVGQTKQSEYTRVQVFSGSSANVRLNNYTYFFLYKWSYGFDPQKPIEIDARGRYTLPPTAGQTYYVGDIQVIVSEVYNDYVILLVKPNLMK